MADVWSADDQMLGRQVALKFLHERFGADEQFVERFRREAQAAAGLQHPNIVSVYDRGEHEGRYWIAMEYVQGAALKDLIERGLSPAESVEIVRQVLTGVRFAHARGIVHRDLKPHNVLVDARGPRARDRLRHRPRRRVGDHPDRIGPGNGAVPLARAGAGPRDERVADIYSVGVILYEALTGRVPFEAETAVAIALKQVSEPPVPPRQINPEIPPALDAVVLKALAKDPKDRFADATEFLRALDAAEANPDAGGTAVYAPVDPLPEEEEKDNRWKWIALAILAAADHRRRRLRADPLRAGAGAVGDREGPPGRDRRARGRGLRGRGLRLRELRRAEHRLRDGSARRRARGQGLGGRDQRFARAWRSRFRRRA